MTYFTILMSVALAQDVPDDDIYEVEVIGREVVEEPQEQVLEREVIQVLPGTGGDAVRAIQNLPGVARAPLNIGQLILRGTDPEDSLAFLDGSPLPHVFHFAGFSTVLSTSLLSEVSLLTGNYSVRYGRGLGGLVDLRLSTDLPKDWTGEVSVDLIQTAVYVAQPLSQNAAIQISGRRSYIDAILNPVLSSMGDGVFRVPRYYDGQIRFLWKTPGGGSVDALWLSSDDRFAILGPDADGEEQLNLGYSSVFHSGQLTWKQPLGDGWNVQSTYAGGPEIQTFDIAPDGEASERPFILSSRQEVSKALGSGIIGSRLGIDVQGGRYLAASDIPAFGAPQELDVSVLYPSAYAEGTVRTGPVRWIPGLRWDSAQIGTEVQLQAVDPRMVIQVGDGRTVMSAAAGGFSQFPEVTAAVEEPTLQAERSWQTSVGWSQIWRPEFRTDVTLYRSQLTNLVSGREDAFRFFSGPPPAGPLDTDPYANDGAGEVLGAEAIARLMTENTTAWVSTTISRSTRQKRPDQESVLFTYDQPVVFTAVASQVLPRNWRMGSRVRLGSGIPYTPVVNRFFDLGDRQYQPVYGNSDGSRLPMFTSIDVRIDKTWEWDNWGLSAYLDLQNATNAQNAELMSWNVDYSEEDPVSQTPIVPAFGVKGEW